MTDDPCAAVAALLQGFSYQDLAILDRFGEVDRLHPCLADAMRGALELEDWSLVDICLLVATRYPDPSLVPVVCDALDLKEPGVNHDDAIWVLGSVASVEAVPTLHRVARWAPDWDEFRQLSKAAVATLGLIVDQSAADALLHVAGDPSQPAAVRDAARQALSARDG